MHFFHRSKTIIFSKHTYTHQVFVLFIFDPLLEILGTNPIALNNVYKEYGWLRQRSDLRKKKLITVSMRKQRWDICITFNYFHFYQRASKQLITLFMCFETEKVCFSHAFKSNCFKLNGPLQIAYYITSDNVVKTIHTKSHCLSNRFWLANFDRNSVRVFIGHHRLSFGWFFCCY